MTGVRSVLAVLLFVVACVVAMDADADPVTVEYHVPVDDSFGPVTEAFLCATEGAGPCDWIETFCAPGVACEARFDLPPGTYEGSILWVRGPAPFNRWSEPPSRPRPDPLVVEALPRGECVHDANGDGATTTADFPSFLGELVSGCGD